MVRHKTGITLAVIGICFIAFYLVVRLVFIQDINAVLAQAQVRSLGDAARANVLGYLITYIIWIYSFKLGMLLALIGGALKAEMESRGVWLFIIGGALYLIFCYVPIGYYPLFFGIQGTITLVLFLFIIWYWMKKRPKLERVAKTASDFRIIGYYFFIVATWNLCGIFGIAAYALEPEIMIKHGLQSNAITLTSHVMIELLLGWLFVFLSMYKEIQHPKCEFYKLVSINFMSNKTPNIGYNLTRLALRWQVGMSARFLIDKFSMPVFIPAVRLNQPLTVEKNKDVNLSKL